MKYGIIPLFITLSIVLMLASCKDETFSYEHGEFDKMLSFKVSVNSGAWQHSRSESAYTAAKTLSSYSVPLVSPESSDTLYLNITVSDADDMPDKRSVSRATLVDKFDSFGIMAGIYTGDFNADKFSTDYIFCEEVKGPDWKTKYYWANSNENYRFYAYVPYVDKDSAGISLPATKKGEPVISYTVPDEEEKQLDLLFATAERLAEGADNRTSVELNFYHALTALKFKFSDFSSDVKITGLSISEHYNSASHKIGSLSWDYSESTEAPWAYRGDEIEESEKVAGRKSLRDEEYVLMRIPQTLKEGTTMTLEYIPEGESDPRTLTADLSGHEWPAGKIVTYNISTEKIEYVFKFAENGISEFASTSGMAIEASEELQSYKEVNDVKQPVGWKIVEYLDSTNQPTSDYGWLEITTLDSIVVNINVGKTESNNDDKKYEKAFKNAPDKLPYYNLSNSTGGSAVENTANCYIVNSGGYYSLPLVYGNTIVNGSDNLAAANGTLRVEDYNEEEYPIFSNYKGNAISDPYIIKDTGVSSPQAFLLWEDAHGLIDGVNLDGDNMQFHVNSSAGQGNAVLAIRDSGGDIMWSWHIWATGYNPYASKTVDDRSRVDVDYPTAEGSVEFMTVPLGWVGLRHVYHGPERFVKVVIEQDGSGLRDTFSVSQKPGEDPVGHATQYQYGRKDPFLGPYLTPSGKKINGKFIRDLNHKPYQHFGENSNVGNTDVDAYLSTEEGYIYEGILSPHRKLKCTNEYSTNSWFFLYHDGDNVDTEPLRLSWNAQDDSHPSAPTIKSVYDPCPVGFTVPQYCFHSGTYTNLPEQFSPFTIRYYTNESDENRGLMELPLYAKDEILTFELWISFHMNFGVGQHLKVLYDNDSITELKFEFDNDYNNLIDTYYILPRRINESYIGPATGWFK